MYSALTLTWRQRPIALGVLVADKQMGMGSSIEPSSTPYLVVAAKRTSPDAAAALIPELGDTSIQDVSFRF
jgi:hypothetical protein